MKLQKTDVEVETAESPVAITVVSIPPMEAPTETVETKPAAGLKKLKKEETAELEKLEAIIEDNRGGEWEIMKALRVVHDLRLYRGTHRNFKEYCLERWDFDRAHADRLIKASEVYEGLKCLQLGAIPLPVSEAQVRPLARLSPDNREAAWRLAVERAAGGRVTMKIAEAAAAEILPKAQAKEKTVVEAEVVVTATEVPVAKREEAQGLVRRLRELLRGDCDGTILGALNRLALHVGLTDLDADAAEGK